MDLPFPEEEFHSRIEKVKKMMEAKEVSCLLIYSSSGGSDMSGHLTYLSALRAGGGPAVMFLPIDGEPFLLSASMAHGEPMHSPNWTTWIRDFWPSTPENIPVNIESWVKENKLEESRIGTVGERMFSWNIWSQTIKRVPKVSWVPLSREFIEIQKIKSESEMKLIRKVCNMTNEGMRVGVETAKQGVSEAEVVARINARMYEEGAHTLSFDSICNSGSKSGVKHSYPTHRKIQKGDLVYLDIGAKYYGYNTDMSRTVMVGKPSPKQREILEYEREAYYTLIDAMKPGVHVDEIYDLAKDLEDKTGIYEKYGREGAYVGFWVSHGMSTGFGEWGIGRGGTVLTPNISPLAFEPMIVILNFGTVVIESMIAITKKGSEVLTPLKLDWM
jgi:Xaa-Pro aminopeptidase